MIRRLIAGAVAIAALAPAAAEAQTVRPVQAFDTPTFRTVFTPRNVPAQVGDTVQFRLAQPGNTNAAVHDVWVVPPGGEARFLGISYLDPTVTTTVGQAGTYDFYCSIHGGLTPNGMNGQVVVTETNPGPPVDPGTPWTDPDWEDPEYPGEGPLPLPNQTEAPTVFEEGDNDPPLLRVLKTTTLDEQWSVRVRVTSTEDGFVTARLKNGKRVVATQIVPVVADTARNVTVKLPPRLQDRARRYRLEVWATDPVELDSPVRRSWVTIGHS